MTALTIGAPQLIWLALTLFAVFQAIAFDGQPKKPQKFNGLAQVIGWLLAFGLMYWGGFFSGGGA